MGFWQNLVAGYDLNAEILRKRYPISSTTISNNSSKVYIVHINENGTFQQLEIVEKRAKGDSAKEFVIPVSQESMKRSSSKIAPHIICDQFDYVNGKGSKFEAYLKNLKTFAESGFAPQPVNILSKYMSSNDLKEDLEKLIAAKKIKDLPKDKDNILFAVEDKKSPQGVMNLWDDETVLENWHKYYVKSMENQVLFLNDKKQKNNEVNLKIGQMESFIKDKTNRDKKDLLKQKKKDLTLLKAESKSLLSEIKTLEKDIAKVGLDYISGEISLCANSHPKKIVNSAGNAKLISDNDSNNFTFRGKFEDSQQALTIGYESSQKAHQFLRYIVNSRGVECAGQILASFSLTDRNLYPIPVSNNDFEKGIEVLDLNEDDTNQVISDSDMDGTLAARTGMNFSNSLNKAINGLKLDVSWKKHRQTVVFMLDAATTGRLSITFYREMAKDDYLKKIQMWHDSCLWHLSFYSKERGKEIQYDGAPSVDSIIECVFGRKKRFSDENYDKVKRNARETLVRVIFDNMPIPHSYIKVAVNRASQPFSFVVGEKFNKNSFLKNLAVVCAILNKNNKSYKKEVFEMSIDLNCKNRDYLFGRLLGAADKLEEYALKQKNNDRLETAALRYMQTFSQHPASTWKTIHGQLNPYMQKVKNSLAFQEIQSISSMFDLNDFATDAPLNGNYLIGYYHERQFIDDKAKEIREKREAADK